MAVFSRGLRYFPRRGDFICSKCLQFSTSSIVQSGHNRWSKIKHDKGTADAKRSTKNSFFSREIAMASKCGGADPNSNPRLAMLLVTAKKAGWPKTNMDNAIARGQGRSTTGAALQNLTLEVIMPPTIALIIEAETDNAKRTLSELRLLVNKNGGTVTPTNYLFQKKGRVAFEKDERNLGVDEVLDDAIEAGAEDVEADEDGGIVVWTEPNKTSAAAEALQKSGEFGYYLACERRYEVPIEDVDRAKTLAEFIDLVRDQPSVQGLYSNVAQGSLSDEVWEDLQSRLDA
ncbi:putative transcriptional regulatory protein [Lachnellula subtilissima]|uniref:Putative transcriptional regulatory protein n=1 Tax=Lachnellula subtilissima TaxID=602034 RepID=A0A8H8RTD2_9HELO|nr:putative transcriptional regulatory protein [Lachnellula subtilissima]